FVKEMPAQIGLSVEHRLRNEAALGARLALLGQKLLAPVGPVFDTALRIEREPVQNARRTLRAFLRSPLPNKLRCASEGGFILPVDGDGDDVGLTLGGAAESSPRGFGQLIA